ncbi:hypothetical protein H0A66_03825 [Alcaligenaceae bacterium]|nr:hypothetical protein [Alcaligenaceae bacterium]
MTYDLRTTLYRLKDEDRARAAEDAKWRKEQAEARAREEAALNSARIVMEDSGFLSAGWGKRIDKNGVYRLIHLLAFSEGVCPYMSHMDTLERVAIYRQAALNFKLKDCLERLMRIEQHFHDFERLSKFDGKTPQTVEDQCGQKTLVASDFFEWAHGMGWIVDSSHGETLTTPRGVQGKSSADDKVTIPEGNTINLHRAIFGAWDSGKISPDASASKLFDFLGKSDESGHIRRVDGSTIYWGNTSGEESDTQLKTLQNSIKSLRARYKKAK